MPSSQKPLSLCADIVQTNSPEQLRIGLPTRKNTLRRYITITKTRVTVAGDSEKHKRSLAARAVEQEDQSAPLPHLPEIKRGSVRHRVHNLNRPQMLRVSSYPELVSKHLPSPASLRLKHHHKSRPCESELQEADDSEEEVENRGPIARELTQLSLDELTTSINIKSLVRSASQIDKTVKQAIDKFLDGSTQEISPRLVKQTKIVIKDYEKNNSIPTRRSPRRLKQDQKSNAVKRERNKKSSESLKKYITYKKPLMPKLISCTPACMVKLFGPILLSAPHGIKLWRGGTEGRKRRIHYREIYITEIVLKLAAHINNLTGYPASFVIWDRRMAMTADFKNLDPNYLTESQFASSPFHEALVQFKQYGSDNNFPIMHIDVHGKKNRRSNMDLDVGFKALESRWENKSFVKWLKTEVDSNFTNMFSSENYELNNMKCTVNVDPLLCGDWGGDLYTMTSQSVCLGIPAFQIEIPKAIRTQLIEDDKLMLNFAKSILNIYSTCINGGQSLNLRVNPKETVMYDELLSKLYSDHIKLEKTFPEKQI